MSLAAKDVVASELTIVRPVNASPLILQPPLPNPVVLDILDEVPTSSDLLGQVQHLGQSKVTEPTSVMPALTKAIQMDPATRAQVHVEALDSLPAQVGHHINSAPTVEETSNTHTIGEDSLEVRQRNLQGGKSGFGFNYQFQIKNPLLSAIAVTSMNIT
ncbi:hypothetical protein H0H81_000141 [Sphagnurus paluster]|uniref:Uncharacterized protein n=1 Tax=Sphagnurus paluster TaxID=117069 RepID=A0A9P7GGP7_9AGAR|nr:hypothetical protein H0H81_000141 [Sphagnurus paluster]